MRVWALGMVAGVDIGFIQMMLTLLRRKTYALVCNTLEIDLFSLLVELDLFLVISFHVSFIFVLSCFRLF